MFTQYLDCHSGICLEHILHLTGVFYVILGENKLLKNFREYG